MSSLFGPSSLFGNLGTSATPSASTQAPAAPAAPAASTTAGNGLFGNLGSTTQQAARPSGLFGSLGSTQTTQQPAATSGLFANIGNTQNNQQPAASTSSLFGSMAPQPAASSSFGMGTPQGNQQPATSSLFGSTATLVPLQQQNTMNSAGQSVSQQGLVGNAGTSQTAYFDSLLQKSKKSKETDERATKNFGEMPSLHLGLGDIAQRVREMGGAAGMSQRGSKAVDGKAHYLLAASGISPGSALRDLNSLKAQAAALSDVQQASVFDTDNAAFVSKLHSQSTLALISEGLNRSARDFDRFLEENVTIEWDTQRRKIYEHFGLAPKEAEPIHRSATSSFGAPAAIDRSSFAQSSRRSRPQAMGGSKIANNRSFGRSSKQQSVLGRPNVGGVKPTNLFVDVVERGPSDGGTTATDQGKQNSFADKVKQLNESRLQQRVFPVLQEFAKVEGTGNDQESELRVDAYRALIEIVKEDPKAEKVSDPNAVKERQFAKDYLADDPRSAGAVRMNKRILDGARRFMEASFFRHLEAEVEKHPRDAQIGGVPSIVNKVRGYVKLRAGKRNLVPEDKALTSVNDEFCWAVVFYLLRSGHSNGAMDYVQSNATEFRNLDRNFATYLANYAKHEDRRLTGPLHDRINAEYNQRATISPENSVDPFRLACYKIIGRCDLSHRALDGINTDTEDWIWLQFNLARESSRSDEPANEAFGLADVRETVQDIGRRYFEKGAPDPMGGHGTFFLLQILAGLFEHAVVFLQAFSYISAVHFAIALDFYGLLRVSGADASDDELLTHTTRSQPQINFPRLIGYYTRDFRTSAPVPSTDYLTLICLNATLPAPTGASHAEMAHTALRELILESRAFTSLLGSVRLDGQRIPGAIEQRLPLLHLSDAPTFLRTVTVQAAHAAEDNGRTVDAVTLYHLAEEYDDVIRIINRALSEAIAIDFGQEPVQPFEPSTAAQASLPLTTTENPVVLAKNLISLYNGNQTYHTRIQPMNREACGVLLRMSEAKGLIETEKWAQALDTIDSLNILPLRAAGSLPLIRHSAQSLQSLPPVIAKNRELLNRSAFEDTSAREGMKADISQKERDLMVYAGLVKLRLGGRVWDALVEGGGGL